MFKKKPIYIVGIVIFTLILAADIAIYFLIPAGRGGGNMPPFGNGEFDAESFEGEMPEGFTMPEDGEMPEGFTRPEGGNFEGEMPEGFTMPEDGEMPEGGDFDFGDFEGEMPEGFTMPEGGNFEGEMPEGFTMPEGGNFEGEMPEGFDGSMMQGGRPGNSGILSAVRSAFWPILIVCLLGDAVCIFMLIRVSKKKDSKVNPDKQEEEEEDEKSPRHDRGNIILSVIAVILVVTVFISSLSSGKNTSVREAETSILQQEAAIGDLASIFSGSGTLTSSEANEMEIPASVKVTAYTVQNGDYVEAEDVIAKVDKNSVMNAIYEIQELIEEMDEEIAEVKDNTIESTVSARADGRVKAVYAKEGESVVSAMYENGALILISLGGSMSVEITSDKELSVGETVTVTLSDQTQTEGKVQQVRNGTITITTTDNGPVHGDTVTVTASDGTALGTGILEISSPLKVTGFTGTVDDIKVKEGELVEAGDTLLTLENAKDLARYQKLLREREELTDMEERLAQMYQDGYIRAGQSGVVSQIDEDITYSQLSAESEKEYNTSGLTSSSSDNYKLTNLSYVTANSSKRTESKEVMTAASETAPPTEGETIPPTEGETTPPTEGETPPTEGETPPTQEQTSVTYAGMVTKITYETLQIKISETDMTGQEISVLETMDEALFMVEKQYSPDSDVPVYLYQNGQSIPGSVNSIQAGDKVLIQIKEGIVTQIDFIVGSGLTEPDSPQGTPPGNEADSPQGNQPGNSTDSPQGNQPGGSTGSSQGTFPGGTMNPSQGNVSGGMTGGSMQMPSAGGSFGYQQSEEEAEEAVYEVETSSVCAITPADVMNIQISVDELDILSLEAGQDATITLDALPGQSFSGNVKRISPVGSNSGGSTKYTVIMEVPRTEQMLDGMNASVIIEVSRQENVLTVPAAAICEDGTRTYVYTGVDSSSQELINPIDVTTGASDGENIEIVSGISEGETIYYKYADSIVFRIGN